MSDDSSQRQLGASNKSRYQSGNDKGHGPGQIKVEPGALENTHPQFFVNDERHHASHEEMAESVNDDGERRQPGTIKKIQIGSMAGMRMRSVSVD